jgi:hypothetical protein
MSRSSRTLRGKKRKEENKKRSREERETKRITKSYNKKELRKRIANS